MQTLFVCLSGIFILARASQFGPYSTSNVLATTARVYAVGDSSYNDLTAITSVSEVDYASSVDKISPGYKTDVINSGGFPFAFLSSNITVTNIVVEMKLGTTGGACQLFNYSSNDFHL